jgi:hypothetical protein
MNQHTETLSERLDILERQNRRWRIAALLAMIGLLAVFAMAQTSTPHVVNADRVRAREFQLIDSAGKQRAALSIVKGEPGLALLDDGGKLKAILAVAGREPWLGLFDGAGKVRAKLDVTGGIPALALVGDAGAAKMILGVEGEHPALLLADTAGKVRAKLHVTEGGPELLLYDADGNMRAFLSATSAGPTLDINDGEGFRTVIGSMDLVTTATGEQHHRSAASVLIFDKKGKVIWSAP